LYVYRGGMTDPDATHHVLADELAALHHPVRRRILELLQVDGPATVGTMAAALGQQVGSISHHLKTLERTGFVVPAADLARDKRESWWRSVPREVTWSVTDYAGSPTETLLATAAEHANLQHHNDKVLTWFSVREEYDEAWVDAAFATEHWARANPEELADLGRRVYALLAEWGGECTSAADREREAGDEAALAARTPVFVFAHGNPSRP
jgi:DNA-binding transcriptional ArsR family regulator